MMNDFIFIPSAWLGEGRIVLSSSEEFIPFYTKWTITQGENEVMKAVQIVELQGVKEHMINHFTFYDIQNEVFALSLESEHTGRIVGKGSREKGVISWEFGGFSSFFGHEKYERQETGEYFFRAQYGPLDDYHSTIEGIIRRV